MMEGPNQPPAERPGGRLDQADASAGSEDPFTFSKEQTGVGKMVEDVEEQDGRGRFITERQRERRADHVDFRSRPEVDGATEGRTS